MKLANLMIITSGLALVRRSPKSGGKSGGSCKSCGGGGSVDYAAVAGVAAAVVPVVLPVGISVAGTIGSRTKQPNGSTPTTNPTTPPGGYDTKPASGGSEETKPASGGYEETKPQATVETYTEQAPIPMSEPPLSTPETILASTPAAQVSSGPIYSSALSMGGSLISLVFGLLLL